MRKAKRRWISTSFPSQKVNNNFPFPRMAFFFKNNNDHMFFFFLKAISTSFMCPRCDHCQQWKISQAIDGRVKRWPSIMSYSTTLRCYTKASKNATKAARPPPPHQQSPLNPQKVHIINQKKFTKKYCLYRSCLFNRVSGVSPHQGLMVPHPIPCE